MTETALTIDQPPHQVKPKKGSRLEQLHEAYGPAKAAVADAEAKLKAITDAIKLELTQAAPDGAEKIELVGENGVPLQLSWVLTWRFDSKKFKADDPQTYVRYAKQSGSWTLRPVKVGDES